MAPSSATGAERPGSARAAARRAGAAAASFPVVGVGASAGGLEAFRRLLANVPADAGLALVLVQHLEARRAGRVSAALGGATSMKVSQAEDGVSLAPNRVYVIPPGAQMALEQGVLRRSRRDEARRPHLPIDHFLRSLAADRGRQAIGVILSGTASEGTAGLAAIRAHGGITFAQDPRTARFGEMPQHAIDTGVVDCSLPLAALGEELTRLARHPYLHRGAAVPPTARGAAALARIFGLLRATCGVEFSAYKPATVARRLARRMAVRKAQDVAGYLKLLENEPGEVRRLHDDLLIQVTSFFRDGESFGGLKATALPQVLRAKAAGAPIRAWVVGCSSGEEVYSVAMSIVEFLGDARSSHPVLVFGSDLSDEAIARARAGVYSEDAMRDVDAERRSRFFVESERCWRVDRALRDLCVFARNDLARDPPFSRLDLVVCRDVLRQLGRALQRRVLGSLHHALNEPGYLLLGSDENVSSAPRLFAPAAAGRKLFARRPAPSIVLGRYGPPGVLRGSGLGRPQEELTSPRASPGARPEDHGRANEGLASADAELLSVNEELQATNEELETAKEELQATNEELTTVNDELDGRNKELQLANADLVNLLESVEIPIVMLDADRRIRRFTPKAGAFLNLTAAVVGEPIGDVALQLLAPDLELWIGQAAQLGTMVESEVQDRAERWHRMQVRPRRALDGRTDGTIISLVDIHTLKRDVVDAEWERDYARNLVEAVQIPLVVIDGELRVLSANEAFFTGLGVTPGEVEGRGLLEIGDAGWNTPELRRSLAEVITEDARLRGLEIERDVPGAGRRTLSLSARSVRSRASRRIILVSLEDVTGRARGERLRAEPQPRAAGDGSS